MAQDSTDDGMPAPLPGVGMAPGEFKAPKPARARLHVTDQPLAETFRRVVLCDSFDRLKDARMSRLRRPGREGRVERGAGRGGARADLR